MNCIEFHREKLADPRRLSAEAQAHARDCAACASFAQSVDADARALERSLAAPVPEGLAERVVLRVLHPRAPRWRAWALAASVLIAVLGGLAYVQQQSRGEQYARLAIEHVVMEPESLSTLRNADPEAFRAVLQEFGGSLAELPGKVRYVRLCPVEAGTGWHVVFETPQGLATLILVPGRQLPAAQTASTGGWNALVRPTPRGYYAIVTASTDATSRLDRWLRERVEWRA
jgi:uncharacterized protein DUF3379